MSQESTDGANVPLKVLSAGAPKTGVSRCAEAFFRQTGRRVEIDFATAPVLRGRVARGQVDADVVVAPLPVLREFLASGRALPDRSTVLGSIRAGVVVRAGAPVPDLSSVEAFKQALLAADSLVYNQASSGLYIAQLMERLGIAEAAEAKTTRVPTGAAVMRHLARSRAAREIGFGQITEIRLHLDQGLELAGPLPAEIGKVTTYAAGILAEARAPDVAVNFTRFLGSPWATETFAATGVE
ncbi:MAG: substrate-binding domain-containing protein [Rhodospirillales bacterium]|nr:substrate-binding domain-containing protein [Rhodospirillales bacterium]